jgi:hypothetical protein
VDGVYVDNLFPEKSLYCFSSQHGHLPGFGPYLIRGFAETFQNLRSGAAANEQFFTYTEAFVEGYIRNGSMYAPVINGGDWMTNDDHTRFVPLLSTLYHHYAVSGPGGAMLYSGPLKNCTPQTCPLVRRTTAFLVASSWINGAPIWTVDTGFVNPNEDKFSFEVVPPAYPEYAAITDFEARVARLRGQPQTRGFLNTGLRLRDLEFLQPSPMPTVDVSLLGSGALSVVDEIEAMPSLISSVWKKPVCRSVRPRLGPNV